VFDQLNLVQLLDWIRQRLPTAKPVSLVCIRSFAGYPSFKGLGELTSDEVASLLETRQRVGDAQYQLAQEAWRAFRAPTPESLDNLRRGDTTALPFLAAALARFLQEFPWTIDGLSRTERRFLQLAAAAPIELVAALPRMHEDEDVYYVTDRSVADLAGTLSRTSPPLLTYRPDPVPDSAPLHGTVALTGVGRAVLAGVVDRIATCGIDRWLGGVHLQRGTSVWRWDGGQQQIRRS
jgi:hypothetical protein